MSSILKDDRISSPPTPVARTEIDPLPSRSTPQKKLPRKLLSRRGLSRLVGSFPGLHYFRVWNGLLVLNYHRIGDPSDSLLDHGLWSATEEEFDKQIRFVKKSFDIIGPNDLERVLARRRGRHVMITFDDGYRDNYGSAYKILQRNQVGATFFLSTGYLDSPRISWWDDIAWMVKTTFIRKLPASDFGNDELDLNQSAERTIIKLLRTYKSLPGPKAEEFREWIRSNLEVGMVPEELSRNLWMTWEMVQEMHKNGMWFGGHTVNHPILSRHDRETQQTEIGSGLDRIAEVLGYRPFVFSYPVGGGHALNQDTLDILREQGIRYAFRYGRGYQSPNAIDPYQLPRLAIEIDTSFEEFRAISIMPQLFA